MWRSFNGIMKSRHLRRRVPPNRSHIAFAWGARTGVRTTCIPKDVTPLSSSGEKMLSRIVDHEAIWMIVWKRLSELLQGPLRGGVVSDVVVEDPRSTQFYDYEHIKGAEVGRYDYEEVACHDRFGMTANEGHPSLLRIGLPTGSGA